jgi:uncharacterized C2H2 Zn-finger protein
MLDPEGLGDLLNLDLEQRSVDLPVHELHAHAAYHRAIGPRAPQPSQPVPLRHSGAAKGPRAAHPPRPAPRPPAVPSERVTTSAFQQMTGDGAPKRRRIEPGVPLNVPLSRGNGAGVLRCANVLPTNLLQLNAPLTIGFIAQRNRPKKMCVLCGETKSRTSGKKNNNTGHFECFKCSPKGKVLCGECGQCFGQNSDLKKHIRTIHEQRKDFQCPTCHMTFGHSSTLARHIRTVHEQRRDFKCPRCDKTFCANQALQKHIRTQHEDKKRKLRVGRIKML